MLARVLSATLAGIEARPVDVEVDVSPGLPVFTIVGLPDMAVRESRERIQAAFKNSGLKFPSGRIAEEVVYGDQTTGAESDIRQATHLARQMAGRFGMSEEIGFVAVLPENGEVSALQGLTEVSERTRQRIDAEVERIVGEAHDEAIRLLTEHRGRLDSLAEALVREETLDQPQAYAAAGVPDPEAENAAAEPALSGAA